MKNVCVVSTEKSPTGFALITDDEGLLEAWAATDEEATVAGVPLPLEDWEIIDLLFDPEFERLDVDGDAIGPVDSFAAAPNDEGGVRIYDDHESWEGDLEEGLRRLRALPDGAGWERTWQAFCD